MNLRRATWLIETEKWDALRAWQEEHLPLSTTQHDELLVIARARPEVWQRVVLRMRGDLDEQAMRNLRWMALRSLLVIGMAAVLYYLTLHH